MITLQQQRTELEGRLTRQEEAHFKKFSHGVPVETTYRESANNIMETYKELSAVCDELGAPIPVRW
jgi:hypothetical protein